MRKQSKRELGIKKDFSICLGFAVIVWTCQPLQLYMYIAPLLVGRSIKMTCLESYIVNHGGGNACLGPVNACRSQTK